jgi:DNA polymerase III, delta subunit
MPVIDAKAVSAMIKKGEIQNLYYLYGEDVSGVEKLTKQIIKAAVGDNEDFALNRINGKNIDVSEFRDMSEMMPMMSEYNCLLVNDYNCEEQREETTKQVIETLKNVPGQTVIIFNVTGFEVKTKFDYKKKCRVITDKNKKIADIIAKNGSVVGFALKTPQELSKEIAAAVSARGCSVSIENAKELAERCLSDPLAIENEIDKLCSYANGAEISRKMIDDMVHHQSGITVFKLADSVAAFNGKQAFDALDELMSDKDNRGSVLASITNSFLDMYRVQLAKMSGRSANDVVRDFGYFSRGFIIERMFRSGSGIGISRLRSCISILCETAVRLNSTGGDEKIVLEQAVARMLNTK